MQEIAGTVASFCKSSVCKQGTWHRLESRVLYVRMFNIKHINTPLSRVWKLLLSSLLPLFPCFQRVSALSSSLPSSKPCKIPQLLQDRLRIPFLVGMRSAYQRPSLAKGYSDCKVCEPGQHRDHHHLAEPLSSGRSLVIALHAGISVYTRSDSSPAFLKEN